jgi:hypothetical protein
MSDCYEILTFYKIRALKPFSKLLVYSNIQIKSYEH